MPKTFPHIQEYLNIYNQQLLLVRHSFGWLSYVWRYAPSADPTDEEETEIVSILKENITFSSSFRCVGRFRRPFCATPSRGSPRHCCRISHHLLVISSNVSGYYAPSRIKSEGRQPVFFYFRSNGKNVVCLFILSFAANAKTPGITECLMCGSKKWLPQKQNGLLPQTAEFQ